MTNLEVKDHLLKWCSKGLSGTFSWPTDACGYEQHIKLVEYRNKNYIGETKQEFVNFVKEYALSL